MFTSPPDGWFRDWQAARRALPETGRWPIAVSVWGGPEDDELFSRTEMDYYVPDLDVSPLAILSRIDTVDVERMLDDHEARDRVYLPDDEHLAFMLGETVKRVGSAPSLAELHAALDPSPGLLAVERWLLDWESDHGAASVTLTGNQDYLDWYTPDNVSIALLPSPDPWASYAYIGGFEWGNPHPDLRAAVARRWHQRFGAEPAANWGVMQQLVVPRPPSDVWTAWELAREISLLWPDTAGGLNGVDTRDHARDLVGRSDWFLHYKP